MTVTKEPLANLDSIVSELLQMYDAPGVAVGIMQNDEVVYMKGFGKKSIAREGNIDSETLIPIGSATKAFTTTAISLLVDQGKLEWDKPVRTYIPRFKLHDTFASERVTLRDMACHRTGMPRYDAMVAYNSPATISGFLEFLPHLKPTRDLRTHWQYNNIMYALLGHVIEATSGMSWEAFVEKEILQPLGMTSTNLTIPDLESSSNYADGHTNGETRLSPHIKIGATGPAGSINSNITDMLQWLKLHLQKGKLGDKQILKSEVLTETHKPQIIVDGLNKDEEFSMGTYGLGWFVEYYRGQKVVHHGGTTTGCQSLVSFMPQHNLGLVVLCNKLCSLPSTLSNIIYDRLLGLEEIDWVKRNKEKLEKAKQKRQEDTEVSIKNRVADTQPSHELSSYTGTYNHPGMGDMLIELCEDGRLKATYGDLVMPLNHFHYDVFTAEVPPLLTGFDMKLTFHGNVNGQIAEVSLPIGLDPLVPDMHFTRKPEICRELLDTIVGKYEVEGMSLTIATSAGEKVSIAMPGAPTLELEHVKEKLFSIKGLPGYSIEFKNDSDEEIAITLYQPNGTFAGKKVRE